jgi:hypothetical protein
MNSSQSTSQGRTREARARPNTADLQPQVPPLSSPRFKHELFKYVDNPIVELNDVPRARALGDIVHKHGSCGAPPDIEVPDTVDKDLDPRDSEGA